MIQREKRHDAAMIVLHEIYGVNRFIRDVCRGYEQEGFDVYCPDLLQGNCFSYDETDEAYRYFSQQVGLGISKSVEQLLEQLKRQYRKVFLTGFSAGATIAWKCCENTLCDGIIGFYGSRIRDYSAMQPQCPVLLLFAKQDSFDVDRLLLKLRGKPHLELQTIPAGHGFLDPNQNAFDPAIAQAADMLVRAFCSRLA